MKHLLKPVLSIAAAIAAASCGNGSGIYRNLKYAWTGNSICQDSIRATAIDARHIISDYPGAEYVSGEWTLGHDISAFASYSAPTALEEALYNMALEESVIAVEPDSTLRTGKEWGGVWTRDISYSVILGMSHIQTECAKKSLMRKVNGRGRIIQDTGTGGSWPCSTDRTVWVLAAWEIYKAGGDESWLETVYPIIKRSLDDDAAMVRDSATGLFKGESSYLDWREQEYPLWMTPVDIYNSENLGTCCVHCMAYRILGQMEMMLGTEADALKYEEIADGIAAGINRFLWMEDKGYYAQYLYGRKYLSASPRFETLGEALAILSGIASGPQAESVVSKAPCEDFGTPCFYPHIPDMFPYHNDAVWPFVQSFWTLAAARTGNPDVTLHGISSIYRAAALFLTNKENMVAYNGKWQGTDINSSRQLWSIAGSLGIIYNVIFGMDFETGGLSFHPMVPETMKGTRRLSGFRYRNAELDITLEGYGSGIAEFRIDGVPSQARVPASLSGRHEISIVLDRRFACKGINMVPHAYSPAAARVSLEGRTLRWDPVEGAKAYDILRNGKYIASVSDCSYDAAQPGEYQVIVTDGRFESFASEPVDINEGVITVDLEKYGHTAKGPYHGFNGAGYLPVSKKTNTVIDIPVTVPASGDYFIDFLYANANGRHDQENKCANRTLLAGGSRIGMAVFAQCGKKEYGMWRWSNPIPVHLDAGNQTISLVFGEENENMNIAVNDAALDIMRITPAYK